MARSIFSPAFCMGPFSHAAEPIATTNPSAVTARIARLIVLSFLRSRSAMMLGPFDRLCLALGLVHCPIGVVRRGNRPRRGQLFSVDDRRVLCVDPQDVHRLVIHVMN